MRRWGKILVAVMVAMMLAAFGISNIGGDTWITASAPLPPGFQRDVHGLTHQRDTARLVPVILVVALGVGALLHSYLTRAPRDDSPELPTDD